MEFGDRHALLHGCLHGRRAHRLGAGGVCGCCCVSRWWPCCRGRGRAGWRPCCAAGRHARACGRRWSCAGTSSAALGALTHVVWDAFTHLDRWGMRLFPVLGREVAGSPLYWYLQYGGSAVAALVIAVFCGCALRRAPATAEPVGVPELSVRDRWWAVAVIGGCVTVGAVQRASRWWAHRGSGREAPGADPDAVLRRGAGLVLGVAAVRRGGQAVAPGSRLSGDREEAEPSGRSLTVPAAATNTVIVGVGAGPGQQGEDKGQIAERQLGPPPVFCDGASPSATSGSCGGVAQVPGCGCAGCLRPSPVPGGGGSPGRRGCGRCSRWPRGRDRGSRGRRGLAGVRLRCAVRGPSGGGVCVYP